MSRKPLVSSIMIFLDAEKFIQEAIESIFAQTYNNWELLLVDDGSTDGSTEVALRYAREHPEKVRYLEHDNHQNRGMSASRNLGISNAKGEFIAFLDADDVWMPHMLEQQVAIMESHPEVGMVYGSTQYWYGWTGNPEDSQCDYRDLVEDRCGVEPNNVIEPPRLLDIFLVYENAVPCICSILMRRRLVENVGGTEDRFQGQYEDQVLLVKVGLQAPVYVAGECWAKYRRHPDSSWWNAQMTGQQYSTRLFFLEWLEGYLLKLRIKDTKAWNALQAALQRCYDLTASVEILEVTRIETDSALLWGHFIDLPKPGTQVAGCEFDVLGWALGRSHPVTAVELMRQGTVCWRVSMNHSRPDLAIAFPNVPNAENGGFKTTVCVSGTTSEFELRVQAVLEDQSRVLLGAIRGRRRSSQGHSHRRVSSVQGVDNAQGEPGNGASRPPGLAELQRITRQLGHRTEPKGLILLYHRVADLRPDPWSLAVTPQHFVEHLQVLREQARPVRLQQLAQGLVEDRALDDRSVVITFDDGYVDNLYNAEPLLQRYDIPASIFLTTDFIGQEQEPWWDQLGRLLLQTATLPETLRLPINGSIHQWELGEAARCSGDDLNRYRYWRVHEDAPSARHSLYRSLWELLHPMLADERQKVLDTVLGWGGVRAVTRPTHRFLSLEEVSILGQRRLWDIGAHTVTHPVLATLPAASQRNEIQQSKARLEETLDLPVMSFSYPYGGRADYTTETVAVVREAGFACACSSHEGVVGRYTDRFQLPRIWAQDWDGREFARQLSEWFDS